eukprot:108986_1
MTMHRPTTKVDDSNGKSDFKLIDEHNEPIPDTLLKKTTATVTIAEDVEGKFGDNDAQFDDARSYYDRQLNADMSDQYSKEVDDFNAIDIDAIEIDDVYLIQGLIPKDSQYHSVNIVFNQNSRIILTIDDVVYLNIISSDGNSPFSSADTNNKTYHLFIGEDNNGHIGDITNITLNISLSTYYQISDHNSFSTAICYQIVGELPSYFMYPVVAYWNEKMIIFDSWYDSLYMIDSITFETVHVPIPLNISISLMYTLSQSWTQIANILYFIDETNLYALNLSTTHFVKV